MNRSCARALTGLLAGLALAACAAGRGVPAGAPVPDPEAAAAELRAATVPQTPLQVTFGWSLNEAGSRIRGRGVARMVAPERVRLDLFGQRGETYLSAALVGDEFRVPGAVTAQVPLPSPALLWASVGVVQPPGGAQLVSATISGQELTLRYSIGGTETLEFVASTEPMRLVRASRSGPGGARETLNLTYDAAGSLENTRYRDLSAFRELVLDIEATASVASFPAAIWRPDDAAR